VKVPAVHLHGSRAEQSAFSAVNRRWHALLAARPDIRLIDESAAADVTLHHDFSTRFGEVPTAGRRRVAVRPWDFGPYPPRWIDVIRQHYDELWVHSAWNARKAIEGGLRQEALHRVPLGIDPGVMNPAGPRADLGLKDAFVFAFVGAAVRRKGIDLLLQAYRRAFDARDPVALVVKDHTRDVFYRDQSYADELRASAADSSCPRVLYLDAYLPATDLAALFRRADAFVLPYRSEGFAMPVLEAMACGTPPIVPAFGAALDYCDDTTGVLATNTLGFEEHVARVHFCETPVDVLAAALRALFDMDAAARRQLGMAAAARAAQWTWEASVDAVVRRVYQLA
jgi:glycosyltransferase involved in cell wall biosynthesis